VVEDGRGRPLLTCMQIPRAVEFEALGGGTECGDVGRGWSGAGQVRRESTIATRQGRNEVRGEGWADVESARIALGPGTWQSLPSEDNREAQSQNPCMRQAAETFARGGVRWTGLMLPKFHPDVTIRNAGGGPGSGGGCDVLVPGTPVWGGQDFVTKNRARNERAWPGRGKPILALGGLTAAGPKEAARRLQEYRAPNALCGCGF
jgi:hypothetical protein